MLGHEGKIAHTNRALLVLMRTEQVPEPAGDSSYFKSAASERRGIKGLLLCTPIGMNDAA